MARDRFLNPASLRVFAVVARRGSLVAAADELHVTHGAISKQIHALEQELGTRLFERRNRGLHLTAGGRWLSERLGPLFADMERIIADFRALDDRGGPLTISCEPTLCLRLLIPLTAALRQETGLDIRVLSAGGTVDFKRDHIDAAIRRSDFVLPPDVRATPLAPEWMGPVLAPSLAGAALAECPILISDTRPDAWRAWARDSNVHLAGATVRYEHFYLALQAAEAGQGGWRWPPFTWSRRNSAADDFTRPGALPRTAATIFCCDPIMRPTSASIVSLDGSPRSCKPIGSWHSPRHSNGAGICVARDMRNLTCPSSQRGRAITPPWRPRRVPDAAGDP